MTPNYVSRMMASTKTLQGILNGYELTAYMHPGRYQEDIDEIKQILAERTLTALLTHGGTEE